MSTRFSARRSRRSRPTGSRSAADAASGNIAAPAHTASLGAAPAGAPAADEAAAGGTAPLRARVVAAHGRLLRVRTVDGAETLARPPGRNAQIVCGDEVECLLDSRHDELRITGVVPRRGALYRSNARGQGELIAANLTLLIVVVAPLPAPDFFIVDRYLAAAQCAGIRAAVLLNKSDLAGDENIESALSVYAGLGFTVLRVSAETQAGIAGLRALLQTQTAAFVGQSGVGKSSLSRALVPHSSASVGALLRDDEGRHTTTAVRLYELPDGGAIVDSPGVRDFAPAIDRLEAAALGFPEIAALSAGCRFGDCRHLREPDCAVSAAVGTALDARRYESYRRLRRLFERLQPPPGARGER
jgi:ribosome biogenesis GTPase